MNDFSGTSTSPNMAACTTSAAGDLNFDSQLNLELAARVHAENELRLVSPFAPSSAVWAARKKYHQRYSTQAIANIDQIVTSAANRRYSDTDPLTYAIFTGLAPGLYAMAYKSICDCAAMGIQRLYFLARDGISLKAIYDALLTKTPDFTQMNLVTNVLHCSRASTVCCRLSTSGWDIETIIQTVLERFSCINFANLISAWNLDDSVVHCASWEDGSEISALELANLFESDAEFRTSFKENVQNQQSLLYAYLEQQEVTSGPSALIDVGWGGTIQQNLLKLYRAKGNSEEVVGMYIGTDRRLGQSHFSGYLFTPEDYRSESVVRAASLTESLLASREHGSTIGYVQTGLQIEPIFRKFESGFPEISSARTRAFEAYSDVFLSLACESGVKVSDLIEHGRKKCFELVTHPSRSFVQAISDLKFEFDWGYQDSRKLIETIKFGDLVSPSRLLAKLWRNPWIFGTLKANSLGFLNRPLTWFLGIDQATSRRIFDLLKPLIGKEKLPHRVV